MAPDSMPETAVNDVTPEMLVGQKFLFPIGHYIGAYHPGTDEPLAYHTVRIGRTPTRLTSDAEFTLWALSHGLTGDDAVRPWGRDEVLRVAERERVDQAPRLLDELIGEDIIIEVAAGTPDAIEFAKAHRVVPLMFGIGQTSEDPPRNGIGLGSQVVLEVTNMAYELWRFGHLAGDLWQFAQLHSEALGATAGLPREMTQPDQLLLGFFWELQRMLAHNVVYLDSAPES
ncbi:MAG: hypothetical protein ACRDT4_21010 [Micromonosporaceae bacterium]